MEWEDLQSWIDGLIEREDTHTLYELREYMDLAEKKAVRKSRGGESEMINECFRLAEKSIGDRLKEHA